MRADLGLPKKDFHITFGFSHHDIHNVSKGIHTLIPSTIQNGISQAIDPLDEKAIEILSMGCNFYTTDDEISLCKKLRAKLYYKSKQYDFCLEDLKALSGEDAIYHMQMGHVYMKLGKYYHALNHLKKCKSATSAMSAIEKCHEKIMSTVDPRHKQIVELNDGEKVQLSRNFSWVIPGVLAGISIPKKKGEFKAFVFMGIRLIVSVLEEETLDQEMIQKANSFIPHGEKLNNIHYNVKNYNPPKMSDLVEIIESMERTIQNGGGVIVHCGGGKGRAGTVLACYVLKNGLDGHHVRTIPKMSASEAIAKIRELRPGSIETKVQENFIREYANKLWSNS